MKVVCSAVSCKYSSEDEDSSNIIFISFPDNDTAAIWAHNCGRPDLLTKPIEDLHMNQYICSNHIEDRYFINKSNPIIISQRAIPTLFESIDAGSVKMNYQFENDMNSLQLTECVNVVPDVCQSQTLIDNKMRPGYQESIYGRNNESENIDEIDDCGIAVDIAHIQGLSIRFTNLCRICGQSTMDGTEIFNEKGIELRLKQKIGLHTPISVEPEDILPQKICSDCCQKLETMHSFVITCLQTDMRLRRFMNITSKLDYDPRFEELVTACTMEMTNEMTSSNIEENNGLTNNCNKTNKIAPLNKFTCKYKENSSDVTLGQVQICSITESGNNSVSNLKYVAQSDLNNILQALKDMNPKNDENINQSSAITTESLETKGHSELVCLNCNDVFKTQEVFKSHEIICNSGDLTDLKKNAENASNVVCPVCRLSFCSVDFSENHKNSCRETTVQFNCRNCDELFTNKDDLDIHELTHNTKNHLITTNRRCGYCSATFNTRKEWQSHINDSHDGQPLFKCGICDKTYEKWSSLDVHEATHRADKPYLCDLCGKSFKHSNNLRGHKRIHLDDAKKKRHVCDVCGSAFRSRFHLREHTNQHNGNKPYTCEECGKAFYKRIQLRQHRLSHGSNKHACPICGMTFNRRGNMNTHFKRHNKSEGMYTCSVCEFKCKSMSELKMHRKQHSESDIMESIKMKTADKILWQCKICDKVFSKRAILLNHERTHTGDQARIECDQCGKKLANKSSLKYHNKSMHSTERPHVCQYCGCAFVSKEARSIHERIHTGERPYTCSICNMQYRCSSNLSQHMKIHSTVRPHICQYCKKTFTRKGALKVHERVHTGLKPFVCEICSRTFSQKNDMLKHTKTHQGKLMQCEKCDEIFESKSDILKHLDLHERTAIEGSGTQQYVEINQSLEAYAISIECPSIDDCN